MNAFDRNGQSSRFSLTQWRMHLHWWSGREGTGWTIHINDKLAVGYERWLVLAVVKALWRWWRYGR